MSFFLSQRRKARKEMTIQIKPGSSSRRKQIDWLLRLLRLYFFNQEVDDRPFLCARRKQLPKCVERLIAIRVRRPIELPGKLTKCLEVLPFDAGLRVVFDHRAQHVFEFMEIGQVKQEIDPAGIMIQPLRSLRSPRENTFSPVMDGPLA
jgi:hypothetical protein